ncbi:hypothetical protein KUCAC02_018174 [Chaenocephalus aceratus]|uniref:Uncharacterized protein n=1 Tax=Chaenocephalus aceratus TaxID=36190 RepID=A0ACB9W971_CHAAC|nr:hypothetical protein KUCAC02_018174 [Chaenocephalus aceratus]
MKLWKGVTFAFVLCGAALSIVFVRNMATIGQFRPKIEIPAHVSILIKTVLILTINFQDLTAITLLLLLLLLLISRIGSEVPADEWASTETPLRRRDELGPLRV